MEGRSHELLALEKVLNPRNQHPVDLNARQAESVLNIAVIFTSVNATLEALRQAGSLASSLGAHVTLLALQVVPYPLPLESPPVLLDWNENRFQRIAEESPVETTVRLYLCRETLQTLRDVLNPGSLVVIGARKNWWPFSREKRLARSLRRAGHDVVFTVTE